MSGSKSKNKKTGSTKIWLARSKESPEVFWIRGRTKAEVKKHLRHFLKSEFYWEGEPDLILATDIFKSYCENLKDCPGLRVDDSRGDVMFSLTESSLDWIDIDEKNSRKDG